MIRSASRPAHPAENRYPQSDPLPAGCASFSVIFPNEPAPIIGKIGIAQICKIVGISYEHAGCLCIGKDTLPPAIVSFASTLWSMPGLSQNGPIVRVHITLMDAKGDRRPVFRVFASSRSFIPCCSVNIGFPANSAFPYGGLLF